MKCPRCGHEMVIDNHRRYPIHMCYECGYMEGQNPESVAQCKTNFEYMKKLGFNELVSFLSTGLGIDPEELTRWLEAEAK